MTPGLIHFSDFNIIKWNKLIFEKRCLTIRTETEWMELVDSGNNILVAYDVKKILSEFNMSKKFKYSGELYGSGNTSKLIIDAILSAS